MKTITQTCWLRIIFQQLICAFLPVSQAFTKETIDDMIDIFLLLAVLRNASFFLFQPVVGMQQSVLDCLSIAYSVGEEPLYTSCMQ